MNESMTAVNGATDETVSALPVMAVSAIASAAMVPVPTAPNRAIRPIVATWSASRDHDREHHHAQHLGDDEHPRRQRGAAQAFELAGLALVDERDGQAENAVVA
jgi:hypothetical protein